MTEDIWKVTETSEIYIKKWLSYDKEGKCVGGMIIVENGSPELIAAIKQAFYDTEGQKST